eukprot:CAMPEP_0176504732 /NCGR_PEP_ID=MMETSP0200_2-20121128/16100_1 /TAXON_ID=947934 /ORGANISM="Chaetoceros sp., Strain GSL56" /LENGTH=830 /DNA_ID=CAMNT_0017904203 /DNA_START=440 /DNA_END=2932 /DNA_ORIENTATION=-
MYYAIWASRSVTEVQSLLMQFIDVFKTASVPSDAPKETQAPNEFQIVGPNIAAAALMRITDIRFNFHRKKGDDNNMEVDLAKVMTPSLLQVVAEEITQSHDKRGIKSKYGKHGHDRYTLSYANKYIQRFTKSSSSFFNLGMTDVSYANVLYTLAKIQIQRKKSGKSFDDKKLTYLVQIICTNICKMGSGGGDEMQCSLPQKVSPVLLTKTLCSLATFDMKDQVQLLSMIGDRLIQGDAVGKLNGRYLSLAMWAYASLERPHVGVLKSFSRRLRKSSVRAEMLPLDITRAVWAVGHSVRQLDLVTQQNEAHLNSPFCPNEDVGALREEVAIMVYTLVGELLKPKNSNHSEVKKINGLNTNQVIDLLGSFIVFEFEGSHPFVIELTNHIKYEILQRDECSATHIAKMLWSFQRLRFPIDNDIIQSTIDKFVDIILSEGAHACAPSTLNQMLRSITLFLPDHGRSYPQLYLAASYLLNNRNYLKNCNEFECSNFLWCYAMAKYYDKEVILSLSERMQNGDIISSLTPSSVSRYLWSFTSLVESNEEDIRIKETLFEMFETLGGILLSAQLKPVDSSKAMWAMAKSSYALNIGIFDHLAEVLSNDSMLERASVQQITQALWSCGKMVSWEDPLREKLEFGTVSIPPYVKSAEKFASFLVSLHERMSAKDISQIIWSLGRLKIMNTSIVYPIANKAAQMAQEECFNSQELANILWGLSKVEYNEPHAVSYFTAQLRRASIMNAMTPQEASNVLYALAKMCIKDEHTFNSMNQVLMRQPENATTQTIANALWAHETIGLIPPRQLFNSWAKEKLHIVGLYVENQQIEIIERSSDDK